MSRILGWAAVVLGVPALQVMLGGWTYKAYRYNCSIAVPGGSEFCPHYNGMNPLLPPVWGVIALWFVVDLALLFLALWVLQRRDARQGAAWRRGALRWRTSLLGAALAIHMLLGYWWVMAYTQRPGPATPGECPACFRRAIWEQNAFGAVDPGVVFLIWEGVGLALLWFGIWLIRNRREAPPRPDALVEVW